ncbi:MAG TPA: trans-aconitate 2-methyltransferase [Caulobacteraceae bacterium]|jgi:trans-aconitate 2-methyltransferase|nr:trans-aconitate 2-methyltransferase [Caulobacteraceae bacterium]
MTWSAQQYVAFEEERTRPVRDLVSAVPGGSVRYAIDLGCGPGNSTEVLLDRFPDAAVSGLDSSPDMIEAARRRLPAVEFEVGSVEAWDELGPFDVILANAVFHWVPDHVRLFPRLVAKLAPGGALAVQMPDNLEEPSHRLMRQVASEGPWAARLAAAAGERTEVQTAEWYFRLLQPLCARVDVWRTTYHHLLAGPAAVVEWFKGSGLRPFLAPLDEPQRAAFLERYEAAIAAAYPPSADGTVLLPFPRLFIVAVR